MIHRDLLMRQIQQMTQALATVIAGRRGGRVQEALEEARRALGEVAGADDPLHVLPVERVLAACTTSDGFHAEKALAVADLLAAQGDLLADRGEAGDACACRVRAVALYRRAAVGGTVRLDLYDRLDALEAQTRDCGEAPTDAHGKMPIS